MSRPTQSTVHSSWQTPNIDRPTATLAQHPWAWKFSESVASSVKWRESGPGLGDYKIWFQSPALPRTCYATLGKLIYFPELDSVSVKQRFTSQGVFIHLVIQEILIQLLLSSRRCSRCWWWWWTNAWTIQGTVPHIGAKQIMTAITLTIANEFCHEKQLGLKDVSAFHKYKALCRH